MRIVCPNCDAQYEVPDDAIPAEGRDVQCSNCGMTWLEQSQPEPVENAPVASVDALISDETEDDSVPEQVERDPVPEPVQRDPVPEPVQRDPVPEPPSDDDIPEPPRRELGPEVAEILRQEADRENAARMAEREGLETQPDLGLDGAEAAAPNEVQQARERMARMRNEDSQTEEEAFFASRTSDAVAQSNEPEVDSVPDPESESQPDPVPNPEKIDALDAGEPSPGNVGEAGAAAAALGSRKQLLPDIEEINSSLQSTEDRDLADGDLNPETPVKRRKRRWFRRGFMWAVLLFVLAILVYIFAPQIAEALPQADPWLSAYVTWVDGLRVALDAQVQRAAAWLDDIAASSSN